MPKKWWEREEIRFECEEGCFKCCMKPGVVYFDKRDIKHAAEFLGVTAETLKEEYKLSQDSVPGVWELDVPIGQGCPFLIEEGCAIHPAKPKQCRSYPFWKENLSSRNFWELVGGFCPGIGKGPRVAVDKIKTYLREFQL